MKAPAITPIEFHQIIKPSICDTKALKQGKLNDLTVEYQEREQNGKLVKTFLSSLL